MGQEHTWTSSPLFLITRQREQLDDLKDETGLTIRKLALLPIISQQRALSKSFMHLRPKLQELMVRRDGAVELVMAE
jgi:hypothetical protein